jgi:hypothetical protein
MMPSQDKRVHLVIQKFVVDFGAKTGNYLGDDEDRALFF